MFSIGTLVLPHLQSSSSQLSSSISFTPALPSSFKVTILCQGLEDSSENTSAATVGIIKSLIGHFNLDPNHVFDIRWFR